MKREEEFELNWRKNCWDHRQNVCSSLPCVPTPAWGTVSKMWLLYVLANYKLWLLLIPRDDLGTVFRDMVFLSMGHEWLERRPETIAFWRYLCKKKWKREEAIYFQMHRYILEFCYKCKGLAAVVVKRTNGCGFVIIPGWFANCSGVVVARTGWI